MFRQSLSSSKLVENQGFVLVLPSRLWIPNLTRFICREPSDSLPISFPLATKATFNTAQKQIYRRTQRDICISSHLHILTSSHLHIFSSFTSSQSSHPDGILSSHLHILHLHTFTSLHVLIYTLSHLHIFASPHFRILTVFQYFPLLIHFTKCQQPFAPTFSGQRRLVKRLFMLVIHQE